MAEIGRGAMGEVYKARDPLIGRLVALKVITSGLTGRPELLERFYQEARSAGALQHPNIVTVYELGKEGDLPFIAMEYLDGESIEKMISRQEGQPLFQKIGYVIQICRALEYAHKHGVVHRDIKPGNIMVTEEGTVKVVDFGIARLVDASKTQTGTLIGTLGYMSPQQLRGEHADERSDIWAVGVLFYELLAYQRPFTGDNPAALMMSIISKEPPPLQGTAAECPADVESVILRMLQKESPNRYQTMEEALLDLDPAWRRLQEQHVEKLVAQGETLVQGGDLEQAQRLLRNALHVDSSHTQAKTLLETVNRELRRQRVLPRVQQQVDKAKSLLDAGQWQQAKAEAQAALQLDSTCEPARELQALAEQAMARARQIEGDLRVAKQRVAAGDLTEADKPLEKILSLDPHNRQAQQLRNQIHEEIERREKRTQVSETMRKARDFWSHLRYAECIALLSELQKQVPDDPEVAKLLETARRDQAEQGKQQQLTEARNLLASGRYDDARGLLNGLLRDFPADPGAQNLLALVVDQQDVQAKQTRLKGELSTLRGMLKEGKHAEVLKRSEELLAEFPQEFELSELANFARAELRQSNQARALEQATAQVRDLIAQGSYEQAIGAADQALAEAPRNADLLALREDAAAKQKEKQRRDDLDKRIREVKARINRDELTGAIEMARETIATLGADTDVSQLLRSAEVERDLREKQKAQEEKVEAAQTLLQSGKTDEATQVLSQAIATQLIDATDPRVKSLFEAVERKKKEQEIPPPPARSNPLAADTSWPQTTPGEPAKDYVFQAPPAQMETPAPPTEAESREEAPATTFSATGFSRASEQPAQKQPPVVSPPVPKQPQGKPAAATQSAQHPPAKVPTPEPAAPKKSFPMAIVGVVVLLVVGAGLYFVFGNSHRGSPAPTAAPVQSPAPVASTPPPQPASVPAQPKANPLEEQQKQLLAQAQQLIAAGNFAQAGQTVSQGLRLKGPLDQDLQNLQGQIQKAESSQAAAAEARKESRLWTAAVASFRQNNFSAAERGFRQVAAMNGAALKSEAENYLNNLIPKARAGEQRLNRLIAQYHGATDNPTRLRTLQAQFRQIETLGGSAGQQAREYADNRIPADLRKIASKAAASEPTAAPPSSQAAAAPAASAVKTNTQRFLWVMTVDSSSSRQTWTGKISPGQSVNEAYVNGGVKAEAHPLSYDLLQRLEANAGKRFNLELSINPQGRVTGGKLLSGNADLGAELLSQAQSTWQFAPPKVNDTPVNTSVKVILQF